MNASLKTILLLSLALLAGSCAGPRLPAPDSGKDISLTPLYGTQLSNLNKSETAGSLKLELTHIPSQGQFIRIAIPGGSHVAQQDWSADSDVVRLLVTTDKGADFGIVPLPGYKGEAVSLTLGIVEGTRTVSTPPVGAANTINDLAVTTAGAGQVNLHWTQINTGDYDLNGEVNIADITPLAQHLGNMIDRAALGANQQPEFWLDGDLNGEVNLADLTPIGKYFGLYVNGYNIHQNGTTLTGPGGTQPTVPRSLNTPHPGLPPTYDVQEPGAVGDSWNVAVVDLAGTEGADSSGGIGPADLVANLNNITGLDLFNLVGGGIGPFGPGKFSSRVIDPIDVVTRTPIGTTTVTGVQTRVSGLPRTKTLLVQFNYAPIVNLATGAPKGAASIRGGAALRSVSDDIPPSEQTISSIPFDMPAAGSVGVDTNIDLSPNPSGGYFVDLSATITYPGDDPQTIPVVETSYQRTYKKRLSYATNMVAQDNNDNGDYGDDADYHDSDDDGISDPQLAQILAENEHEIETEHEIEGTIDGVNFTEGSLHLIGCIESGVDFPADVIIHLSENTTYHLRHRTDANPDGVPYTDYNPHELASGQEVDVTLFDLKDIPGGDVAGYWAQDVRVVIDDRTSGKGGGGGGGGGGA